jgi:ligand-binding sensor domain-containing protein
MKSWRSFLLLLYAYILHLNGFCQTQNSSIKFTHLTTKDGLCSPDILSIYQDKSGYIWFCTRDGLQRFDGKNFKTFYNNPNNTNSLPDDFVATIKEDKFRRYWIAMGDNGGLSIY